MRFWYLRRAIPWIALLGCSAAGLLATGLLHRWPSASMALLPAILACCAAAAAFVFDEQALSVVSVTPRGATWRRTTRLSVAALPLGVWTALIAWRPGDLPLTRAGWLLAGAATILLVVGMAGVAARRELPAPGALLAPVIAIAVFSPVVITLFLGWSSIYPVGDFESGVRTFWLLVAGSGVVACAAALRPGVRR
ncbi:MAG: hypothetical protein ACRDOZ_14440 [Nocardioides sp.]